MSGDSKLHAAILIISETAAKNPSTDHGIPTLQEVFAAKGGGRWIAEQTKIVSDDILDIQRTILGFTDGEEWVNLVVTSGGTGFTRKDVTPEVSFTVRRYCSDEDCARVQRTCKNFS